MNNKLIAISGGLLLAVGLFVASNIAVAQPIGASRVRWDYTITSTALSLQTLGNDGWELVAVNNETNRNGSIETRYYFKRPK
ncbi:MAG: hypothetical protein ACQKBV_06205 [Puniceicoccales bacterium]